ncbi:MAG: hypothetical protein F4114_18445 [Rhodospirillaceae bacterium]|nr:hypothetical protein [Rhodospirillaceae bacterium]MYB13988.1 hypothetical protein [Rhodospirillaceae bacterium]MYI51050.1 hypothetical protein [Rhodospirillaceae bacterium]
MRWIYRRSLAVACLMFAGAFALPAPAAAMQILEAVDHAELAAEVSATEVNRIALIGDRIARVVRAPDGYAVEHDAVSGDLWLRRVDGTPPTATPVTLFLGTEKGFTYRLTLTPSDRDAAQILIRNAALSQDTAASSVPAAADPHLAALVKLVRAVARREPIAGYEILAGGTSLAAGLTLIETWRGPRFRALVFEAGRSAPSGGDGLAGLAGTIGESLTGGHVSAFWLAGPGTGPRGGRLVVAVVETARMETPQ